MAAKDEAGERRRTTRSLDERKRIVEEALASGASVAAVARRHGLNANLIFKWIRRSREGWRERRRGAAKEKPGAARSPDTIAPAFVPVKQPDGLVDLRPERQVSWLSTHKGAGSKSSAVGLRRAVILA
jgi:transposase